MPTKPRLLIAADVYPDGGGISAIIENIIAELQPQYEVDLAIVHRPNGSSDQLPLPPERIHAKGSTGHIKPYLMPTSLIYPLVVGRFLRSLVTRIDPDALLVQDGLFLPIPGLLATRGTRTKLAVMDHGTITNSLDPHWQRMMPRQLSFPKNVVFRLGFSLDRPWRDLRWRLGLGRAAAVWYVGHELQPWLERAGARAARYAQVVPHDFVPATPEMRAQARALFEIPQDATVVNMVTRLAPEKGLEHVVESLAKVKGQFDPLVVLVVGDGPLESRLTQEIRRLDLPVRLLGRMGRQQIALVHHASDFHLYAGTIGCGMSIALLEAMASGVVPIASDVPAEQRSLIAQSGWVFEAGDFDALHAALVDALSSSEEERSSRRALAIERVRDYRKPRLTDRVSELLQAGDLSESPA